MKSFNLFTKTKEAFKYVFFEGSLNNFIGNIIISIFSLIGLIGLGGCNDDFDPNGSLQPSLTAHYLRPSETLFESSLPNSFTRNFEVESYETTWTFTETPEWISLNPNSGSKSANVSLTATENKSVVTPRTAIFYLKSTDSTWSFSQAMSVSQGAATPAVSIDESSLIFGGAAGEQTVNVQANCEWDTNCSAPWVNLTSDVKSGKLNVAVTANSGDYRFATIYLKYGSGHTLTIDVTQSPAGITASAGTLEFENVASKYNLTIEADAPWTTSVSESWISVRPPSGESGKSTVEVEVAPNTGISSRKGYVSFNISNQERLQITIVQKGIYIESDNEITFSSRKQTKSLAIRSNTNWELSGKPDWVSVSKNSGKGNGTIDVTVEENPSLDSRNGELILSQPGLSIECKVKLIQSGKSLNVGTTLLEFSDKGGTQNFSIESDVAWNSSLNTDWFTATPLSGNGDATIKVTAEENNSEDDRLGTITYSWLNKTTSVNVHQLAKYFTIGTGSFEFESHGGTHNIDISTNDDWSIEIEGKPNWLKLSKTSGSGSAEVTLTASDNASVNSRKAIVIISAKNSQSVKIEVIQKGRYLTVSTQSILLFSQGGTSETVSVHTDGTYDISQSGNWFTVNKGEGNTFSVTATKNTGNEMRKGSITISMTGLKEGSLKLEIAVIQAGEGGTFVINGYPTDSDWNKSSSGSLSVTINGYSSDKDWDSVFGNLLNIKLTGYGADQDWNK